MIIGHQRQWNFLKSMTEMGKIPHALLFSGQDKLGKKRLAFEFANFLINAPKIENHPDFIFIEPALDKKEIQISQIREIIWKLSLHPYSAPYKVAIIDQAHQMNQESQNCFLKTLEEPKGKSILILITEYPELLFSTIISRVQKIRFFPVKKTEILSCLGKQGIPRERAEYLYSLSLGKPGLVIDFLANNGEKIKEQEKIISSLEKISQSDFSFRFQRAKDLQGENIKKILGIWLDYFRNLFLSKMAEARPLPVDRNRVPVSFNEYSLPKIKKIINLIQSTDYLISTTNVNPKLALEILLMEL